MVEYASIKVERETTLRWIVRMKGLLEHMVGSKVTMDFAIQFAVAFMDWKFSTDMKMTKKEFAHYKREIQGDFNRTDARMESSAVLEELEAFIK